MKKDKLGEVLLICYDKTMCRWSASFDGVTEYAHGRTFNEAFRKVKARMKQEEKERAAIERASKQNGRKE